MKNIIFAIAAILIVSFAGNSQTPEFTYQGRLVDGSLAANDTYQMQFSLYDTLSDGTQIGSTITNNAVTVTNGVFSVVLDFTAPNAFDGSPRFLAIAVKRLADPTFTPLTPRQPLTSAPYSIKSLNADTAANSIRLDGRDSAQYVITTDARMTDARTPLAGSADYIQNNPLSQQTSSSFNINGTGRAGIFEAATQFNINGNRILSNPGTLNLFAGVGSGAANTTGSSNSFFGNLAGQSNSTGSNNTLFGRGAGFNIVSGSGNSFFGRGTGAANVANNNSFFGDVAGASNNSGTFNSFFGGSAGNSNTSGSFNSFFGHSAGTSNATSGGNSYFGHQAGSNSTGNSNTFVGFATGLTNTTGSSNTLVGATSNVGADNLSFATAIGAQATVGTSNTIALGRSGGQDTVQIPGALNIAGTFSASIFSATTQYNIGSNRILGNNGTDNLFAGVGAGGANASGGFNAFFGSNAGLNNQTGSLNAFFGRSAGFANVAGDDNAFFGTNAGANTIGSRNSFFGRSSGQANIGGSDNVFLGMFAGNANSTGNNNTTIGTSADLGAGNLNFATAIGAGSVVSSSNTITLGRSGGQDSVLIPGTLNVTGPINGTVLNATNATTAQNALNLGGVAADQYVITTDPRMTDERMPTAGSNNYIQNTLAAQSANFNISGTGTAGGTLSGNVVNATTQFNIGNNRILGNPGSNNLFAGVSAGSVNTGFGNAFVGYEAGRLNQSGSSNTFVGSGAGQSNVSGSFNAFFGAGAGRDSTATENSFFGYTAGANTTSGSENSFFGRDAGNGNTAGAGNSFLGKNAGNTNTTGNYNTVVGYDADISTGNLTNANAIGSRAFVSQSNSLILGSISGVNGCVSGFPTLCESVRIGIGTTVPSSRLHVIDDSNAGLRVQTNTAGGTVASFGGNGAFQIDRPGIPGGRFTVLENGRVGIGTSNPTNNLLEVTGTVAFNLASGGATNVCQNFNSQISTCSSSIRYKQNIHSFSSGLDLINRLRPVTFNWKADNREDLGLVAEEVAGAEPLLVTYNDKGEIEGVKYDRVGVVLINAVKEQQAQIESQRKLIESQQAQIDALKNLVCQGNPRADICKK